jgi:hypothetical protein
MYDIDLEGQIIEFSLLNAVICFRLVINLHAWTKQPFGQDLLNS